VITLAVFRKLNSERAFMKIGILEAGLLNEKLDGKFEPYPVMFADLLNRASDQLEYQAYSVIQGEMPPSIDDCDGWLITGSRHGVYENLDWMLKLQVFIRELFAQKIPLAGICFGHQIIAQALGGQVLKSEKGWGVGLHSYHIDEQQPWMKSDVDEVRIYAFHQDQIVKLPPQARVFSSSDFCANAGLVYGDSIISVQAHPEFAEEYELALLKMYSGNVVPKADVDLALERILGAGEKADTHMLAEWIAGFFLSR